jgi:probable HAF family extracellular repeat protein
MAVVVLVGACARPATGGSYTLTSVNAPSFPSRAYGINDGGAIVGICGAGDSIPFINTGGSFTVLNYPGGTTSNLGLGINNAGQVVGQYTFANDPNSITHAFLYKGGNYQTIDPPVDPSQLFASASAINNRGQIVVNNLNIDGSNSNYLYSNGQFTLLSTLPAAAYVQALNDAGTMVGGMQDANGVTHGFLFKNGQLTQLDAPNAGLGFGFSGTQANGINNNDVVVGNYVDHSFTNHGFVYQNGVFTTFDDPLADTSDPIHPDKPSGTEVFGINDEGQIVGWYYYTTGNGPNPQIHVQAFLATPVPEPCSLALVTIAGLTVAGWRLKRRA